jgi:hypothetical protein
MPGRSVAGADTTARPVKPATVEIPFVTRFFMTNSALYENTAAGRSQIVDYKLCPDSS